MLRKWLASLFFAALFVWALAEPNVQAAAVYWEGTKLVKGQIGKIEILKPINLWKKENGTFRSVRVLKPGEQYRVYSSDGKQYGLGNNLYVTNIKGYVLYKTPPKEKLKLVNPERYGIRKLSLGTVTDESSTVIVPGVKKSELEIYSDRGKQHVYKLDINLAMEQIGMETALSDEQVLGIEPVLDQAKRADVEGDVVLGAVNGDYFKDNGSPTDLMVHNGEIITTNMTPIDQRVIFGINANGKAMIGNPDVQLAMTINGKNPHIIHSINKRRDANHLVLYTPYFSATTLTNSLGTEVVLTNLQGKLNGNGTMIGTVKEVVTGVGSAPLLPGEIVLSGHGEASSYLKQAKIGDTVEISIQYDQAAWNGVEEAIGGRYRLVAGGVAQSFNIAGVHPRTAIGIDKNGNVFTVVVDGRNPSHSNGVTLNELAKLMKDFGAVDAMTFDGGGSSTFVVRQPNGKLAVINKPSDGTARPVANSLLVVYRGQAKDVKQLAIEPQEITLWAGETYRNLGLSVKGVTLTGATVPLSQPVTWSSNAGTFLQDGSFIAAKQPTQGTMTASLGSAAGSIGVRVVNEVDQLMVQPNEIYIHENGSQPLSIQAFYQGKKIMINPTSFRYTVSNGLGTVENGTFKAAGKQGTGTVTVQIGAKTAVIPVTVGIPDKVTIEDFENTSNQWLASGTNYVAASVSLTNNVVQNGQGALQIAYDFSGKPGTSGVYAAAKTGMVLKGRPTKIGMWLYGDAKGHWLRAQIKDGSGKRYWLDFAKSVDWTGWKYVTADLPSNVVLPITLEMPVRYMEVNEANKNAGTIYIDDIQAIYN
ncbi:phosphodiester glycosidase family protein [Anoxybacteroides tepidamans]|uniref:phosphodiester glycosidase family protein n=1 Tax=Anoxybacteroides tepidamans TaxID=265948 RepID=UPI000A6D888B|nr:phosphodiester glycosidase family protein [Anoxybacillus tepidamans]